MEYYKFFRVQLTGYADYKSLKKQTNDLVSFAKLFRLRLHIIQDAHEDSFLLELSKDEYLACLQINAIISYCEIHKVAKEILAETPDFPIQKVLKSFS